MEENNRTQGGDGARPRDREPVQAPAVSKQAILFVAAVGAFLTPFMGSAVNIAMPAIEERFQMSSVLLSWVGTSYLLAAAVAMAPAARLADIAGRRKILIIGMAVFTLGTLGCGLALNAAMLIGMRGVQGVGSAMIFATSLALVTAVFPPGERGRAIGINVAAVYTGLSLGPVLGGVLTENLGWRSVFFSMAPIGLLAIGLMFWKVRAEWAGARGEPLDYAGSVMIGLSLVAMTLGLTGLPDLGCVVMLLAGVLGVAVFVIWELRVESPVFEVRLFRESRVFAFSNLAALLHYSATFGVIFLLSLYLQYIKNLSPQQAGAILMVQPVMMALFSPVAGWLSDRIEPLYVASSGMGLTAIGLIGLSRLGMDSSMTWVMASLFVLGLGYAFFSSPNTNAIMSSIPSRYLGIAGGAVSTMRLMGQMVSMGVATLIFSLAIGSDRINPEVYPAFIWSLRTDLAIFSAFCLFGVASSLVRGRMRPEHGPGSA